jgi:hypothetical protein
MMTTAVNRNSLKVAVLLLIAIFILPAFAMAYRQGPVKAERCMGAKMRGMKGTPFCVWNDPEMVERLALSEEQVSKLKEADFAFKKNFLDMRAQMDSLQLEMEKAFAQDSVKDTHMLELGEKMSEVRSKMFMARIESRLELKKILNDEQFKKLGTGLMLMPKYEGSRDFGKFDGKMKRHWKASRM